MIPYFKRLKDKGLRLRFCILCKQSFNKRDSVLVFAMNKITRYVHIWCLIKYSFKKRLENVK